jgi:hypothetical protein
VFLLFNDACLAKKQQIPRFESTIYQGKHSNHYTTDAILTGFNGEDIVETSYNFIVFKTKQKTTSNIGK